MKEITKTMNHILNLSYYDFMALIPKSKGLLLLIGLTFLVVDSYAQDADIWRKYTGQQEGIDDYELIPDLADYSYAGYKLGEEAPPISHPWKVFDVTDYGAIADDGESDKAGIQAAIHAAEANGSGVVYFPAGHYDIMMTLKERQTSITIRGSNIILKGAGSTGPNATTIEAHDYTSIVPGFSKYSAPFCFNFSGPSVNLPTAPSIPLPTFKTNIVQDAIRGAHVIKVADASVFVGEKYIQLGLDNSTDARTDYLDGRESLPEWELIHDDDYAVSLVEYHTIASVDVISNEITLKDPVIDDINHAYGWYAITAHFHEGSGFEDIYLKTNLPENFSHSNPIHNSGYRSVGFKNMANSWITRCRFSNSSGAISLSTCYASSVLNVFVDGNRGHTLVACANGSSRCLMGLITDHTDDGTYHGTSVSIMAAGNVSWRVEQKNGEGPDYHAGQPRTNLIDHYKSYDMTGKSGAVAHYPHHLTGMVFWNSEVTNETETDRDFWGQHDGTSPHLTGPLVNPIVVGIHGVENTFLQESLKYEESNGTKVSPASLYEAQLEHRLVTKPAWVDAAVAQHQDAVASGWASMPDVASVSFTNVDETRILIGANEVIYLTVEAAITGNIERVRLYLNDVEVRTQDVNNETSTFSWGDQPGVDAALEGLTAGEYNLTLEAITNDNKSLTATNDIVIEVAENLALNRDIVVSNEQAGPNNVKAHLVNGDENDHWSALGFPQDATIDLGGIKRINKTELIAKGYKAYQFKIQVAPTQAGPYTSIVDRSQNTDTGSVVNNLEPIDARFVKITILGDNDSNSDLISLNEFRVFGTDPYVNQTPLTGVSITDPSVDRLILGVDETTMLTTEISPNNTTWTGLNWSASNGAVSVDDGVVKGVYRGIATVKATTQFGGFADSVEVEVLANLARSKPVAVSAGGNKDNLVNGDETDYWGVLGFGEDAVIDLGAIMEIDVTEVVTFQNRAYQFKIEGKINALDDYTILVNKENNTESGPIVDQFSSFKAARYIKLTVTGTGEPNSTSDWVGIKEFKVFGKNIPVTGISVSETEVALNLNDPSRQQQQLTAMILPSNATEDSVIWLSQFPRIASVDSTGNVTAIRPGTTIITAYSSITKLIAAEVVVTVSGTVFEESFSNYFSQNIGTPYIGDDGHNWTLGDVTRRESGFIDGSNEITAKHGITGATVTIPSGTNIASFAVDVRKMNGPGVRRTELHMDEVIVSDTLSDVSNRPYTFHGLLNLDNLDGLEMELKNGSLHSDTDPEANLDPNEELQVSYDNFLWAPLYSADASGVAITESNVTLNVNELASQTKQLTAVVSPDDAADKSVVWISNHPEIATVDENGLVTAVDEGTAYITATTNGIVSLPTTITVEGTVYKESFTKLTGTVSTNSELIDRDNYIGDELDWDLLGTLSNQGVIEVGPAFRIKHGEIGLKSQQINGGLASFSIQCRNVYGDGLRKLNLRVNGEVLASKEVAGKDDDYTFSGIVNYDDPYEDFIVIEIENASEFIAGLGSPQVVIDSVVLVPLYPNSATDIDILEEEFTLNLNDILKQQKQLEAVVSPVDVGDPSVRWESVHPEIATVDETTGLVTAVDVGTATIKAIANGGQGIEKSITVTVEGIVYTESFTNLTNPDYSDITGSGTNTVSNYVGDAVINGENIDLVLSGSRSNAGDIGTAPALRMRKGVTGFKTEEIPGGLASFSVKCKNVWNSEIGARRLKLTVSTDEGVHDYSPVGISGDQTAYTFEINNWNLVSDGVVIELANASTDGSGGLHVEIDNVRWVPLLVTQVEDLSISEDAFTLNLNDKDEYQNDLTLTVSPEYATDQSVTWESSDTNIATVDEATGKVTAVDVGVTDIIATANDGSGVTVKSTVTVEGIIYKESFTKSELVHDARGESEYIGDADFELKVVGVGPHAGRIDGTSAVQFRQPQNAMPGEIGFTANELDGGMGLFSAQFKSVYGVGPRTVNLTVTGTGTGTDEIKDEEIMVLDNDEVQKFSTFFDIQKESVDVKIQNNSQSNGTNLTVEIDNVTWSPLFTIPTTGVVINEEEAVVELFLNIEGELTKQLTANIVPAHGADRTVIWSSSDTNVATVNAETGLVTAFNLGLSTITATITTPGGSVTATKSIEVKNKKYIETFTMAPVDDTKATYIGDHGFKWEKDGLVKFPGEVNATTSLRFQKGVVGLKSQVLPGGIQELSVQCKNVWHNGSERTLKLFVNDVEQATWVLQDPVNQLYTFTETLNLTAETSVIEIKNVSTGNGGLRVAIDSVTWIPSLPTISPGGRQATENDDFTHEVTAESPVLLYPNPTSDNFRISGVKVGDKVSIYTLLGQKVKEVEVEHSDFIISVASLESGVYMVSVNGHQKVKMVKE